MAAPDPDFFISYNKADRRWAEWIAWQLEDAGFSVVLQAWDFRPGSNFILEMDRAAKRADRTIAVLSPDYLEAAFTQPEWGGAVATDPEGLRRGLIPIRVRGCQPTGLLGQIVYIDLVGREEATARDALLSGLNERGKPELPPAFPGDAPHAESREPAFPGQPAGTSSTSDSDEGTWVKVGDLFLEAETVEDAGSTITISGQFDEDVSRRLERLRPSDFGRTRVRVVHGDRVVDADVARLRRSHRGRSSQIDLELNRAEVVHGDATRAGTGGLSPDDLVEAGLRQILLGEPLPSSLGMMEFMADPGVDKLALVQALRRPLAEARHVGRLILTEGLVGNGHAAAVTRFELVDAPEGRRVHLEWEEPRVYTNVEPGQRRIEGLLDFG